MHFFSLRTTRLGGWAGVALAAALLLLPGCVRRRLFVRSNPPGATVYVDNQPVGVTPCATNFTYYGTREIRLVKPGFETLTINQPIPAPWFEIPPIDFFSENVAPNQINDYRTVTFNLQPQVIVPNEQLIGRGEQLRVASQAGAALPPDQALPWSTPMTAPPTTSAPGTLPPPGTMAPVEPVSPGVLVPPSTGAGVLPPGGRSLEPLPALQ